MKILNLYAGIGGNRKLWSDEHEITAVESVKDIADAYKEMYPNDRVLVGDAHQYLLDHYKEFDFIWSSPPCPTHSQMSTVNVARGRNKYPDMSLYREILWLKHFFKGKWVVENVVPFYSALITPTTVIDRHFYWSNFPIVFIDTPRKFDGAVTEAAHEDIARAYGLDVPVWAKDKRKLLRNAVDPIQGLHILNAALREVRQEALL